MRQELPGGRARLDRVAAPPWRAFHILCTVCILLSSVPALAAAEQGGAAGQHASTPLKQQPGAMALSHADLNTLLARYEALLSGKQGHALDVPSAIRGFKELSSMLQAAPSQQPNTHSTQHAFSDAGMADGMSFSAAAHEPPIALLQPQEEDELLQEDGYEEEEAPLLHQLRPLVAPKGNEGRVGSSSSSSSSSAARETTGSDGSTTPQPSSSDGKEQTGSSDPAADGSTEASAAGGTVAATARDKPVSAEGRDAAAKASFILAALSAAALLPSDVLQPSVAEELQLLQAAAQAGSLEAQLALADRWLIGRTVPKNCHVGVGYLRAAAATVAERVEKDGNYALPHALVRLRERWADASASSFDGGWADEEALLEMEEDLALRGDTVAYRRLGVMRLTGRGVAVTPAAAFADFTTAASAGDAPALFNLGYMHLKGIYVPKDASIARKHFFKAAARGSSAGQNGLGVLAFTGEGGAEVDYKMALRHFEAAANQSNADGMYNLGMMLVNGLGTPKDAAKGLLWFDAAYNGGHWRAPYAMALLHLEGAPGIKADCEAAEHLLWQFVAGSGPWPSNLRRALSDLDAGRHWTALVGYLLLAEQGAEAATANAAWMLERGVGFSGRRATRLAARLFERSGILNSTSSMVALGNLLQDQPWLLSEHPGMEPDTPGAVPANRGSSSSSSSSSRAKSTDTSSGSSSTSGDDSSKSSSGAGSRASQRLLPPEHPASAAYQARKLDAAAATAAAQGTTPPDSSADQVAGSPAAAGGSASPVERTVIGAVDSTVEAGSDAVLEVTPMEAAVAWYRRAVKLNCTEAMWHLAWMYQHGHGVPKDMRRAEALVRRGYTIDRGTHRARVHLFGLLLLKLEHLAELLLGPDTATALTEALLRLQNAIAASPSPATAAVVVRPEDDNALPGTQQHIGTPSLSLQKGHAAESRPGVVPGQQKPVTAVVFGAIGALLRAAWRPSVALGFRVYRALDLDKLYMENVVLTLLLGALATVLWLRARPRARLPEGQQPAGHDREAQVAAGHGSGSAQVAAGQGGSAQRATGEGSGVQLAVDHGGEQRGSVSVLAGPLDGWTADTDRLAASRPTSTSAAVATSDPAAGPSYAGGLRQRVSNAATHQDAVVSGSGGNGIQPAAADSSMEQLQQAGNGSTRAAEHRRRDEKPEHVPG